MAKTPNHPRDDDEEAPPHYLREWREFMGWTQEELAEMANVHHTKIGRLENRKRGLKTDFLNELAKIFGVPASALIEVNPSTDEGAQTAEMFLAWKELPKDKRADLLTIARALTNKNKTGNAS